MGVCMDRTNLELLFDHHKHSIYWVLKDFSKFSFLYSPSLSVSLLFLHHILFLTDCSDTNKKSYFYKLPTLLLKEVLMRLRTHNACVRSVKYREKKEEISTHQGSPIRTDSITYFKRTAILREMKQFRLKSWSWPLCVIAEKLLSVPSSGVNPRLLISHTLSGLICPEHPQLRKTSND